MRETRTNFRTLTRYFFTRFFENDLLQSYGDTTTTIVRALAIVAAPGLIVAFFLQNQYPGRPAWGRIEDHYFFVVYALIAMAGVAVFEWEMLFPDRLDFLVLSPLPLRERDMLAAKATALAGFLGLFLAAQGVFGAWLLPVVSKEAFERQLCAHVAAVVAAGSFGALSIVSAGGLLLCVLPARAFRVVSSVVRTGVVATLGLMLVHYVRFVDVLDRVLSVPGTAARRFPGFWFLGLYERVQHGSAAAPFAAGMMWRGLWATAAALTIAVVSYPFAWKRMRRMALEGSGSMAARRTGALGFVIRRIVRTPASRAVFYFIGQTLARDGRYQVYLAMYCGTGVALAIACVVTFAPSGEALRPELSAAGLRAVVPLLLFWTVAGLRMAFALPMMLQARWIFRATGTMREACVSAGRVWVLVCGVCLLLLLVPLLAAAHMGVRALLVQVVMGACLCAVLVDGLMFSDRGIPFAEPRSPGKTSLPLMLTLFIGVLPVFVVGMVRSARWLEQHPLWLMAMVAAVPLVRAVVARLRRRSQPTLEDVDVAEGEFQLLGLGSE